MNKKEDKNRRLINQNNNTSESIPEKKNIIEEALKESSDEVLAKAIRELLNQDKLH
ncbi:MAG TPA: hypothetical protein PLL17_06285 [Defluviitaleaceae bacterium]|nr:hypothetical protein [Candidatus Epulonipiscium sp.]HOQ16688.1 hypothetical protein [Defluviitaleaceae bacterium]HPT77365.1 hypothetical protein [Defluviitaleaceae bacterium]HQD50723.1 hypothetical protein [Defluviitaleaceae bacterium]